MQFLSNIAQFLLVVGISFVVITLVASFIRFQNLSRKAREMDNAIDSHDAFQVQIANRLGTAHLEPEPFLVMMLAPDPLPPPAVGQGEGAGENLLDATAKRVEKMLRGTDTVVPAGGGRLGVIVDATRESAGSIVRRILDGVRNEPAAAVSCCAGISTYPENGSRVKTLVEGASASLQAAVLKGRGQWALTAFEDAQRPAAAAPDIPA